jgi:prophage tail gpP-like protein
MVWPSPQEVAVLTIDGYDYSEWESVQVRHSIREVPLFSVRFTCSEGMPLSKNWAAMRIIPGQWCTVTLGGQLAVSGWVYSRQVYVDARRHRIEILAGSNDIPASYATVVHPTGEEKNIDGYSFLKKIYAGIGINFGVIGGSLPSIKFPRISITPGSTVLENAELVLRHLGHFPMTSSPVGGVFALVSHPGGEDTIYEGDLGYPPYLSANEVIFNSGMAKGLYSIGQGESHDTRWGAKNASVPFLGDPFNFPFVGGQAPLVTVLELPMINPDQFLAGRLTAEKELQGSDEITVIPTVRGWMRPSGGLWDITQKVHVVSPMLVMDGSVSLIPKSITFLQDNEGGTRTTLELCNEKALGVSPLDSASQ